MTPYVDWVRRVKVDRANEVAHEQSPQGRL